MNGMTFEKKMLQVLCENKNGKSQMDDISHYLPNRIREESLWLDYLMRSSMHEFHSPPTKRKGALELFAGLGQKQQTSKLMLSISYSKGKKNKVIRLNRLTENLSGRFLSPHPGI